MEGNAPPKLSSASEPDEVRLIVKSANQQSEDLIIHSPPSWTVRRLKMHLCQVHPSNPTYPDQKIIYSGQLLNDELILKDILRSYKDVETENHIFHLVYTPKISATRPKIPEPTKTLLNIKKEGQQQDKPATPVIAATDGLRHRNVASSSSSAPSPSAPVSAPSTSATPLKATEIPAQQPQPSTSNATATATASASSSATASKTQQKIPNTAIPLLFPQVPTADGSPESTPNLASSGIPSQLDNETMLELQKAMQSWIQQIYDNYIEQCLKLANEMKKEGQMPSTAPSIPVFMQVQPFTLPSFPNVEITPRATTETETTETATTATPTPAAATESEPTEDFDRPSTSRAARANFAPRVIPVIPAEAEQPQPATAPTVGTAATPAPAPAPAPAENVEQPQPRFPNIVQEEQDNHDWLDSFYSVTRLLTLLTLVYFYSSPLRCLIVAIIAFGIYLYHTGFFQNRRQNQANNRNINNNQNINDNNAPPAGDAAQAQETPQAPTEANQNTAGDSEPLISSAAPPEAETTATSLIAFVRTFVVSFFASLLPETPAL